MNTKKILAMIVSVAMVVAMIPAFGIVASAATVTLEPEIDGSVYKIYTSADSYIRSDWKSAMEDYKGIISQPADSRADMPIIPISSTDSLNNSHWTNGAKINKDGSNWGSSRVSFMHFVIPAGTKMTQLRGAKMNLTVAKQNNMLSDGEKLALQLCNNGSAWDEETGLELTNGSGFGNTLRTGYDKIGDVTCLKSWEKVGEYPISYNIESTLAKAFNGQSVLSEDLHLNFALKISGSGLYIYTKDYDGGRLAPYISLATSDPTYSVTVNYVDGDTVVGTYTDGDRVLGQSYTPSHSEYYASEETATLYKVGTPETIMVAESGNVVNIPVTAYKSLVKADAASNYNLVENGSFEGSDGSFDVTGWSYTNNTGAINNPQTEEQNYFYAATKDGFYFKGVKYGLGEFCNDGWGTYPLGAVTGNPTDGNWYIMGKWNDGWGGLCGLVRNVALTSGKSYVVQYDVKLNADSYSNDGNGFRVYTTADATDSATETGSTAGAITDTWKTVSTFVDATDDTDNLWFRAYNFQNVCLDNLCVYEIGTLQSSSAATVQEAIDTAKASRIGIKSGQTMSLTETVSDEISEPFVVTWESDNTDVISPNGENTVASAVDSITKVKLTPSITWNNTVYTGNTVEVTVFPVSKAGAEYNVGAGVYSIGTENIISANGTAASFENAEGAALTGWSAHTGAETNGAMIWLNNETTAVPDGNWAYGAKWADDITSTDYCTIDTMWPVEAGTYYLSFYGKKEAERENNIYVYYSEDNEHHNVAPQETNQTQVTLTSDWVKYEFIIEAPTAGYIGFTGYNLGLKWPGGLNACFDDFELYTATSVVPQITETSLGKSAKGEFAINIMLDSRALDDSVEYGIVVTDIDGSEITKATLESGKEGFTLEANPFRTYKVAVTANGVAGDSVEVESIYAMVVNEIARNVYNESNKITDTNIALIKTLLEDGGKDRVTVEGDIQQKIFNADGTPKQVLIDAGLAEAPVTPAE